MKTMAWLLLLLVATSVSEAATYYMSSTGDDSNSGLSTASAWSTPNHALNCGDIIIASPGLYPQLSQWGNVTCSAGNDVAWLKCAAFDTCKISVTQGDQYSAGMQVGQSYWGIQGWEVTTAAWTGACFFAYPATAMTNIHHIIFANDIAKGCGQGGFSMAPNGAAGVDYFAVVGDIVFNATQGSYNCTSGVNTFHPHASDTLPGTHIYVAGTFAFDNVEPSVCAGEAATDGQGFFFDSTSPYSQQMVMDNNIAVFNGGSGIKSYNNNLGSPNAMMYFRQNTTFGNETGYVDGATCAEIALQASLPGVVYKNLFMNSDLPTCIGLAKPYLIGTTSGDDTIVVYDNYGYSSSTANYSSGSFLPLANIVGVDPSFAHVFNPGAPECEGSVDVPHCMSPLIAGFAPKTIAAKAFGYQVPSSGTTYDPLFPLWICNINLPAGLVTPSCHGS